MYESKYFRELLICIFPNKISPGFVVQGLDVNRRIFKEPKCLFLSYMIIVLQLNRLPHKTTLLMLID